MKTNFTTACIVLFIILIGFISIQHILEIASVLGFWKFICFIAALDIVQGLIKVLHESINKIIK